MAPLMCPPTHYTRNWHMAVGLQHAWNPASFLAKAV